MNATSLRRTLEEGGTVVAPGAYNALFARFVERAGFPAVYISGAGVAQHLTGQPDLGMVSLDEMVSVIERASDVVSVPIIADADTGYGGVHNVARTVRRYERAGVSAIQLEDQTFPKKCGHFDGKTVVDVEENLQRLRAALDARTNPDTMIIARTDAAQPLGLDEAIKRARRYGEAGADILFVEAPRSREDLERIAAELSDWPLVANMVEFGKTPLLPVGELSEIGFQIVIYPGAITRMITPSVERLLSHLAEHGSTDALLGEMATFDAVNAVVGLSESNEWERRISEG